MKIAWKSSSKLRAGSRLPVFLVIAVAASCVVPVAISWACGPNRSIQTDRDDYSPGQTVHVTGANFEEGAEVEVKLNGTTVANATVSATGNISASFPAPSTAGTYALRTDGVDSRGQALAGAGNTITFTVTAPAQSPSGGRSGSSPATSPQRPTTVAPAPGRTSGGRARSGSGDTSRSVSGGEQLRREAAGRAPTNAGVNTTEGVIRAQGTTSFAGSVPRATRVAVAARADGRSPARAGERGSAKAAVPSEGTAASEGWSGLGKSPSLVPGPTDPGVAETGGGSGLTWALALLGIGALVLAGVGVAEVQRRRKVSVH